MALRITLSWSDGPRRTQELRLELPGGSTVADALAAGRQACSAVDEGRVGIWGRKAGPATALQENDRVEIYRPLLVDPKTARRERFKEQGVGRAGLFAKRRPGAKAGY